MLPAALLDSGPTHQIDVCYRAIESHELRIVLELELSLASYIAPMTYSVVCSLLSP
jgi:hypothetical protein